QNAVEPRQLPHAVIAVPGLRIDPRRPQQADLVIEPQLPPRDLGDLRKFADTKHFPLPHQVERVGTGATCPFDATSKSSGYFRPRAAASGAVGQWPDSFLVNLNR